MNSILTNLCLLAAILLAGTTIVAQPEKILTYTSSADLKQKLNPGFLLTSPANINHQHTLVLNRSEKKQAIVGFGGTFSEATSYNFKRIRAVKRKEVIEAFFDPVRGAGWTVLRTTINSCDASSEYYSYCETPDDTLLNTFSIQKDIDNYMIPALQQILKVQPSLRIFASPWTPPTWMKDSQMFNKGSLLKQYYPAWALYFSKYISAYQRQGIPIWSITPQNEPEAWEQRWDACGWTPASMHTFIKNHLGPQLKKDHPGVKMIAYDHNKNHLLTWCDTLLGDSATAQYIDAIAHHWYENGEAKMYEPLQQVQQKYPGVPLIASEQGVFGLYLLEAHPSELYAMDIIGNMNNGTSAWVVWGMAFDHLGGPNHASNFNHSPIMINVGQNKLHYNPSYYYIAHFSRFVRPGAWRIGFTNTNPNLHTSAFQNTDGKITVVVLNITDHEESITLHDKETYIGITVAPHSIKTLVY